LLHLVFAVWKTGKPFDPGHYPWEGPVTGGAAATAASQDSDQTAGHKPDAMPAGEVVTAACADKVAQAAPVGEGTYIDFAHLKGQLPIARVLGHLGLAQRLAGSGPQRRCACPIH